MVSPSCHPARAFAVTPHFSPPMDLKRKSTFRRKMLGSGREIFRPDPVIFFLKSQFLFEIVQEKNAG